YAIRNPGPNDLLPSLDNAYADDIGSEDSSGGHGATAAETSSHIRSSSGSAWSSSGVNPQCRSAPVSANTDSPLRLSLSLLPRSKAYPVSTTGRRQFDGDPVALPVDYSRQFGEYPGRALQATRDGRAQYITYRTV